jgi:FKBP-type peptidyl-prolyl cis-trans isomerase FklB
MGHGIAAVALLFAGLGSGAWAADAPVPLSEPQDKINYSVGFEFGHYLAGLKGQGTGAELEAVFRGVRDALSGAEPRRSEAEIRKQLDELKAGIAGADEQPKREPVKSTAPARTRGFVDDFAALNAQREGVISLPSGLQYEVLRAGTGTSPQASDRVAVQYEGRLATGVVFDSTYDDRGPARLRIDEIVVPGLREALLLMKEGDKWRVVVPPSLGFGRVGNNMLRKRVLIYEVELVSVETPAQASDPDVRAPNPPADGGAAGQPGSERPE